MTINRTLALTVALFAGTAVAALAQPYGRGPGGRGPGPGPGNQNQWDNIGTVGFSYRNDRDAAFGPFGGSVEQLRLEALDSGVQCRSVTATFSNGERRNIFTGNLATRRPVVVDLPGAQRMIRRIDFVCHADDRDGSRVNIAADIGRYQAEWRRGNDWNRFWSGVFDWPQQAADNAIANWEVLGTERFDGPRDRATTFTGMRGTSVQSIGLRPVNGDLSCARVTATFDNGRTQPLNVNAGQVLVEDRFYNLDLPGDQRNVTRIDMTCRTARGRAVDMQVLAAK